MAAAGTDAAASALLGHGGGQAGGGAGASGARSHHLATPRWAKQLASKAQKGLNKLRDSLQD